MLRRFRASLSNPVPVLRSGLLGPRGCAAALAAATLLLGAPTTPARAQACGGTETVLIQIGSGMRYRANLASDDAAVIQFGSPMKYVANLSDPGIGLLWTQEGFNDSSWPSGSYGVGYETAPPGAQSLLLTTVTAGASSVFTRARFAVDDPASVNNLFIAVDYDDGVIAWVNGVEVFRSAEMPAGTPAWNTSAALHESSNGAVPNYGALVDISALAIPVLHAGENILAIGVWNNAPTSTDLVLVPRLSASPDWTRAAFADSGWAAGTYGIGYDTNSTVNALALIRTSVAPGTSSVFTRVTFSIADVSTVTKLFLGADYDDGFIAWINGVEVFGSAEMPFGRLSWNTPSDFHESSNGTVPNYGTLRDISARGIPALHNGANVLAIGVWNRAPASQSTDLLLVPRLSTGEADACDGIDNDCDGLVDEGFPNFDGDNLADCVDPDDDNDGIADVFDCAPLDPGAAAAPPAEVRNVLWTRGPVRSNLLTWRDQGSGVRYDLAGGLVSELRPAGGVIGALCVADDLAQATFDDTRPAPPVGDAYYYIVRAEKPPSCGTGSYGVATSGAELQPSAACP